MRYVYTKSEQLQVDLLSDGEEFGRGKEGGGRQGTYRPGLPSCDVALTLCRSGIDAGSVCPSVSLSLSLSPSLSA